MAHAARTHASWMSALVLVAIAASCVTWLCVPGNRRVQSINGTTVAVMLSNYQTATSPAQGIFKVNKSVDHRLTWVEECCVTNVTLDESKSFITVEDKGIYLIYLQATYDLKDDNNFKELSLFVDFNHTESGMELAAAFDTQRLTANKRDAHLSAFLLLNMQAKEKLSVRAYPEKIKYDDYRPFSTYITIVKYADW